MGGGTAAALVEVPDVVGETQAQATTDLEAVLFVVAVETAYSASIAVGLVISQDPVGGEFAAEGSTVTITVSLGPEPETEQQATGGWLFWNVYELELQQRRAREKKRKELEEETEQIQDDLDRAIAQELRKQEAIDEKRNDIERLREIAKANADLEQARQYSERVATAYARALAKGTFSSLEALDRELKRAKEEEDFLATAVMMLLD
jgi:beta-lactam-binding protein with PASTA domain